MKITIFLLVLTSIFKKAHFQYEESRKFYSDPELAVIPPDIVQVGWFQFIVTLTSLINVHARLFNFKIFEQKTTLKISKNQRKSLFF